jgi:hypothetical protein
LAQEFEHALEPKKLVLLKSVDKLYNSRRKSVLAQEFQKVLLKSFQKLLNSSSKLVFAQEFQTSFLRSSRGKLVFALKSFNKLLSTTS